MQEHVRAEDPGLGGSRSAYWLPLAYLPLFLAWYFWLETRPLGGEIVVASPLDDLIPFNEWFILAYGAWFPYLLGVIAWLYWRDRTCRTEIPRFAFLLITGMTICMVGYTLWSTSTGDLRPAPYPRENWATDIVASLQAFDTPTNVFPSMHVYSSIVVAHCLWVSTYLRDRPWIRWASAALATVISLSTAVIKQHSILDAFGALALFLVLWALWRVVTKASATRARRTVPS
ncbi:MAG: phosphatase PAP2 family protein [bacterium]|nr:phosphatase PAP2 family protein [bacterium]